MDLIPTIGFLNVFIFQAPIKSHSVVPNKGFVATFIELHVDAAKVS